MSRRSVLSVVALAVAALASIATKWSDCGDVRIPRDGAAAWDAGAPLVLGFSTPYYGAPAADTAAFMEGIRIVGPEGEVPFFAVTKGDQILICPDGGLAPDTAYTWSVGPFDASSPNEVDPRALQRTGEWAFRTGAALSAPARSEADCRALALEAGDVGCSADTGDTGDTE